MEQLEGLNRRAICAAALAALGKGGGVMGIVIGAVIALAYCIGVEVGMYACGKGAVYALRKGGNRP
jgi:hypothetical protein